MKTAVFVDKTIKMSLPSNKRGVFVDKTNKLPLSSMKRVVFMDGGPGYFVYLHDLGVILSVTLSS